MNKNELDEFKFLLRRAIILFVFLVVLFFVGIIFKFIKL
jgi:hypothetical protein